MTCFVYRAYDVAWGLLYIGCTEDIGGRMIAHRSQAAWFPHMAHFSAKGYPSRHHALAVEARAIRLLSPRYNRSGLRAEEKLRREMEERAEREAAAQRIRDGMAALHAEFDAMTPEDQAAFLAQVKEGKAWASDISVPNVEAGCAAWRR